MNHFCFSELKTVTIKEYNNFHRQRRRQYEKYSKSGKPAIKQAVICSGCDRIFEEISDHLVDVGGGGPDLTSKIENFRSTFELRKASSSSIPFRARDHLLKSYRKDL
ncbi:hypothetical protein RUM44_005375 [Polyplax serrata]|uniref:Uncharacterized protein n=1 Tax=Polyplax serrata TaxID=468196 RepID=A0ABR1ADD5_POLSC